MPGTVFYNCAKLAAVSDKLWSMGFCLYVAAQECFACGFLRREVGISRKLYNMTNR